MTDHSQLAYRSHAARQPVAAGGRWLAALALLALALGPQGPVVAQVAPQVAPRATAEPAGPSIVPATQPGCLATTHNFTQTTPIPINDLSIITSTIPVSGLDSYIYNVTVRTDITHTSAEDLNIYLIGPNDFGIRDALSTNNGGTNDNVFSNTLWSDQAPLGVTEVQFANNVNKSFLIPEGAMGNFHGRLPNGLWQLVVQDTLPVDSGRLNSWYLSITTLPFDPPGASQFPVDSTSKPITNPGTLSATLNVSGLGPVLNDVTVETAIAHSNSSDLKIVLTSPTGLTTTLVNGRGGAHANLFNGTLWLDGGDVPVTDADYSSGSLSAAQPEGAMGHFRGSDPNGTWTLSVTDMVGGPDSGSLNAWQLGVYTAHCDDLYLPAVKR